jgi:rubrerythrin
MKTSVDLGVNHTGLTAAPVLAKEMIKSSHDELPEPAPDGVVARQMRAAYAKAAPPIGTVPPPLSLKGAAKTTMDLLSGNKASVLIDKLGERLAFERTGVRLYDALLRKLDAKGAWREGPSREDLVEIQGDELRHFALVRAAVESLGGDPTVQTPSADIEGVACLGLVQVLTDPRTDLREGLQAILHAEAADREGWELLITLADGFGKSELAASFREALEAEERHLMRVRGWLASMTQEQAFGTPSAARRGSKSSGTRSRNSEGQRSSESEPGEDGSASDQGSARGQSGRGRASASRRASASGRSSTARRSSASRRSRSSRGSSTRSRSRSRR